MSQQSRWVAGFINQLTTMLIFTQGAFALTAGETNSIVACVENERVGQVILNTRRRTPVPAPQVSYLPGVDGEIIMTADFDGLACNLPTKIIRFSYPTQQKGLREIRIGQLQESPPVCRVSVTTDNIRALKALSFKSLPGSLIIRWPTDSTNQLRAFAPQPEASGWSSRRNSYTAPVQVENPGSGAIAAASQPGRTSNQMPPAAPPIHGQNDFLAQSSANLRQSRGETSQAEPRSTRRSAYSAESSWSSASLLPTSAANRHPGQADTINGKQTTLSRGAEEESETVPDLRNQINSQTNDQTSSQTSSQSNSQFDNQTPLDELKPPLISLSMEKEPGAADNSGAVFRLHIKSEHSLTYSTFRLSNPERYVIDFTNCPELVNAQLPDVQESEFIRSIRVGQPDDATKTRLVIDLINEPVAIKEQVQREANLLTIRLSRNVETADTKASQLHIPTGTTIVLDAGHGGSDPGAQRGEVQEKEITLSIIERLRRRLESRGFKVTLTRFDDTFVSLEDRVRITNSLQPTLFLSVHINAMETANDIHGIETYYQTEQSRSLADAIHENLVTKLEAPDRAVRKARFYVINHTPVPAVLAEVGFISNKDERDKLISSDYQAKVADALEQGVMLYLDKQLTHNQSGYQKTAESDQNSNIQPGTMKVGRKSNYTNTRIAQRRNQLEDAAR